MFSHVTVGSNDLDRAAGFYDAMLSEIGLVRREVTPDGGPRSLCWVMPGHSLPRFYVYEPFDGNPAGSANGGMTAFLAHRHSQAVDCAYQAAMDHAGGRG